MTSIEILERAEDYVGIHYINGVEEPYINPCLLAAIKDGVEALRAQQQSAKNDPLTLEGLREMDGEPVWVQCGSSPFTPNGGYYCLCDKGHITTPAGTWYMVDEIPHWIFYRHKPEED